MPDNLISAYWRGPASPALRTVLPVLLGIALLTASAKIQIPFWPVPMTLQTFAVLLIGAGCGAGLAVLIVIAYLAAGAIGLPVFASGAGLAYMAGPTGGFLAGFVVAAWAVGEMADRGHGRSITSALLALALGEAIIFGMGTLWLTAMFGVEKALAVGVLPFLLGEALKLALATAVWPLAWAGARK